MDNQETKRTSQAYAVKIALKFLALIGVVLFGSLVLTLLKYAGISGAIPSLIAVLLTLYGFFKVSKSEGGKTAGFIFLGLVVFGVVWAIAVGTRG